jgi:arylsulfatase A-like enzyme
MLPVRILLSVSSLFVADCVVATELPARPNIVLILADDIGYSDYGCFGGEIRTPHIDSLARDGMCGTQFYNNAVCVPTRYSLLTGLYPRYIGERKRIGLSPDVATIAEVLREAGYRTSLSGKWHLGSASPNRPIDRGFDEYYGLADGCCNYFNPAQRDPPFEGGDGIRDWMHNERFIREFPADFYSTDAIADHACEQIKLGARSGRPCFVHVCFTAAHSPLHAKPADIARYAGKYSSGWEDLRRTRHERQKELGIVDPRWTLPGREPEFVAWKDEPLQAWNENLMAVYAAMVDSLDQGVGRILKTLETTGADKNTLVILLNDNGGCAEQAGGDNPSNIAGAGEHYVSCGAGWAWAQNTPFRRYKAWVHEGGISTPLLVRWPGVIRAGSKNRHVGHVIDFMPTLLEVAAAKYPLTRRAQPVPTPEGQSLLPGWRGKEPSARPALYWASLDNRAIRQGDWKLVWDQNVRKWELYDLSSDRTESNNLATTETLRVNRMSADWQAWAERTGAVHQLGNKYRLKP